MNLFHLIEGSAVVLRRNGVYRQAPVYSRGVDLYAKWGAGFVRLRGNEGTTLPDCAWETLDLPGGFAIGRGQFGAPMLSADALTASLKALPAAPTAPK